MPFLPSHLGYSSFSDIFTGEKCIFLRMPIHSFLLFINTVVIQESPLSLMTHICSTLVSSSSHQTKPYIGEKTTAPLNSKKNHLFGKETATFKMIFLENGSTESLWLLSSTLHWTRLFKLVVTKRWKIRATIYTAPLHPKVHLVETLGRWTFYQCHSGPGSKVMRAGEMEAGWGTGCHQLSLLFPSQAP